MNPSRTDPNASSRLPTFSPTNIPTLHLPLLTHPIMSALAPTSPPTSPLPKRLKKDHDSTNSSSVPSTSIDNTMSSSSAAAKGDSHPAHSATTPAVTKVEQSPALLIKKLSDKAKLPTRGSEFAAGYDLYAAKETVIPARGKALVDTDISMAVPAGTCMSLFTCHANPIPQYLNSRTRRVACCLYLL